jgi:stearoyl-CoA desaturase (delta-9 desaturase)
VSDAPSAPSGLRAIGAAARRWLDSEVDYDQVPEDEAERIDWLRTLPFLLMHIACLAVIWVGWSPVAVAVAIALYALRMLAITGFYHRYFSHKAFKTSRPVQFAFAVLGASAAQRGPLWWAAHHRHHHAHADQESDAHSPRHRGFWYSHVAWFMNPKNHRTRHELIGDLNQFPELRFLDRYAMLVPALLAVSLFLTGVALEHLAPGLGTNGWQMLVWGFVISTVVLYHATFTVNSMAHTFGRRRYATRDDSRNNLWLALLTFGEGWHNNHHHFPGAARQGFFWWEIDLTWYCLRLMQALGLIWDVRPVPERIKSARLIEPDMTTAEAR